MKTFLLVDILSAIGIFILVIGGSTSGALLLLKGSNAYFDRREQKRIDFLRDYTFPLSCYELVQLRYPHLTAEQVEIAFEQLRLYFEVCLVYVSPRSSKLAAMPSKLVDTCWHAFICDTREYQRFCEAVFRDFLHHESIVNTSFPLVDISADDIKSRKNTAVLAEVQAQLYIHFKNQLSAARIYRWSQATSSENSRSGALQIPLLFSIDRELNIKDGYFYSPEMLEFLAKFDLKAAEVVVTRQESEAAGGSAASCGDGGSCGGCGGSI